LFASVAGTLAGFGMNILRAEAFSNRRGLVLDTFLFADPNRTLELNPSEVERLREVTERVVTGKKDVRELLKNRPKPKPPSRKARIPATVSFDPDASDAATLIEIVAEDRPGLLYDLASAIFSSGAKYRSGAGGYRGAQSDRRVLCDCGRKEAGGGNDREAGG
jgi:[protein-PII] uridylyltransferase